MRLSAILVSALLALPATAIYAQKGHEGHNHAPAVEVPASDITKNSQWNGKNVAFLGDSMTDPNNKSTDAHYWSYLSKLIGINPFVYARSGFQWDGIYKKAEEMRKDRGDEIDAIIIWAGTNDYNHSKPLGNFFTERLDSVNVNGSIQVRKHRTLAMNDTTFCGNINRVMSYLKHNYPTKQIIIMTPIHRAYAKFSAKNVQPDENYANAWGLYIDSYIDVLRQAASVWAVPLIDLYSESGLYPLEENHGQYFHDSPTDRLHPNANGHYRIARTIQGKLQTIPPSF